MEVDEIIPMVELNVNALPPEDRFEAFAKLVKNSRTTQRSPGPFNIDTRFWKLGPMVISEQAMDAVTFDRTTEDINVVEARRGRLAGR